MQRQNSRQVVIELSEAEEKRAADAEPDDAIIKGAAREVMESGEAVRGGRTLQ